MDIQFLDRILEQSLTESAQAAAYQRAWRPPGWIGLVAQVLFHLSTLPLAGEAGAHPAIQEASDGVCE